MSGTTGKKATQATAAKTKKRSTRKKVAKTSARKTRGSDAGVKKKAVRKKPVAKKAAAKKTATRNASKKAASSKGTLSSQPDTPHTPEQASAVPDNQTSADTRSLSWMSTQAASALRAVKASQAVKGQTILARTRKQTAGQHIDDDSLIEIAASMPVDNDSLVEFSREEAVAEEQSRQAEAPLTISEPVEEATSSLPDTIADSAIEAVAAPDLAVEVIEAPVEPVPEPEPEPGILPPAPPPPEPAKRGVRFHPALAAAILLSLLLGYYFWPGTDGTNVSEDSAMMTTPENTVIEAATVVTESVPVEPEVTTAADMTAVPAAAAEQESTESFNGWTPAGVPGRQAPSDPAQTATVPSPAPEPQAESTPAPIAPAVTQQAQPAAAVTAPAPAQRNYRAPAYGSYPQQRQPAYPQQRQPAYPQHYYR